MNADPRRPEKVQRYTPKTGNGTGEDLTPDYMNILGQQQTAGNMTEEKHPEPNVILEPNLQLGAASVDDVIGEKKQNVIPTSPQYGVAIIPNANPIPNTNPNPNPNPNEETIVAVENENTTTTIATKLEDKELHSTPSRNDRFKVVKIASLEPFKRGRWKCMDYVDESPPNTNTNTNRILPQSTYMQTQSLPQQQIQQMLLQTGTHPQFFTPQLIPQNQFFYPQNIPQQVPQFIGNQYFQNVLPNTQNFNIPQSYPNVQYIPIQNQNSAFVVPTSQPVQVQLPTNFQQSQSYAGIGVSQTNVVPLINGHGTNNEPVSNPTGKNVIPPQPIVLNQNQVVQQQQQNPPTQQYQPNNNNNNNPQQQINNHNQLIQSQSFDHQNLANNVYRNPQFTMSVNSLTVLENSENSTNLTETNSANANSDNNIEDPSKSNPVVNAIDNKIEQAMDLVKSHLMYTVREEVEVLKEKIAELMEKIQQLETENNFLRSQIPKNQQQNNAGFSADGNNVGESGNSQ